MEKEILNLSPDEDLSESYKRIIVLLCKIKIPPSVLESLKNYFKCYINSVRSFSNITDLVGLLAILERRNLIGVSKLSKIFEIAKQVGCDERIGRMLNNHATLLSKKQESPICYVLDINLLTDFSITLPESAFDIISTKVRSNASDFARNLSVIPERKIDSIDDAYCEREEKIREVLRAFLDEAKLRRIVNPFSLLYSALEKLKRRDIIEEVEELLIENLH